MLERLYVRSRRIHVTEECMRLAGGNDLMAEAVHEAGAVVTAAMGLFAGEYRYSVPSFPALRFDLPWRDRYVGKLGGAVCELAFAQLLLDVYVYANELHTHIDGCLDDVVVPSSEEQWIQTLAVETICYIDSFLVCAEHGDEASAWTWWTRGNRIFNEATWKAHDLVSFMVPHDYSNSRDVASLRRLADT